MSESTISPILAVIGDDRPGLVGKLSAAPDLDVGALTGKLERISNALMVDITLDETIRA